MAFLCLTARNQILSRLQGFPDGCSIKNADKTVLFADFWVILCRNGKVCLWDTMILY